ncbi:MAG: 30S ribosomal protein S20 [Dehalococcoidales bacterium]|nr:30S ribosomal protein S20 [Dehalococcoidales bacterium]
MSSKSAAKQTRRDTKKHLRNKAARSTVKTDVTRAEKLIFAGNVEEAKGAVAVAISALDKAAEKSILHANNAARRKSRLMRKLNQAQQMPAAKTETDKPDKK